MTNGEVAAKLNEVSLTVNEAKVIDKLQRWFAEHGGALPPCVFDMGESAAWINMICAARRRLKGWENEAT